MCRGRTRQQQSRGSQLCSTAAIKVWADGMGRKEGEESEAAAEHISHGLVNGLKTFSAARTSWRGERKRERHADGCGERVRGNLFLTRVDLTKIVENAVKIICAL